MCLGHGVIEPVDTNVGPRGLIIEKVSQKNGKVLKFIDISNFTLSHYHGIYKIHQYTAFLPPLPRKYLHPEILL